ncbi:hypothetical protein PGH12_07610 [Chryseobacterium wangxinyae]|uniref:hypothetical protein n=1 Tax=Chryseobacterium sp. CY350 TaxID=2997336 RepID=UPI00226F0DA6|nr:hypothetical protein [Chryseobacterium sp. CY350]MCY0977011.1 hypothetical protein [Chryseobacterium sp. CY350]WBZ97010.1 hypothetical protein PGH12_07610 [Chryseobacterium sp. CY350]
MKRVFQIILLIGSVLFFVIIIKYYFFTDNDKKFYKDGWDSYENKQYDLTIFYLNHVDKNKYPDAVAPLGFSYMEKKDYNNAISNLIVAYENGIGKNEGYFDKITNSLGICYMQTGDLKKSKYFLSEAKKQGNPDSEINLKILDSLEQVRNK